MAVLLQPERGHAPATLRVGATAALPAALGSLGANRGVLLAGDGLDPALFGDPENLVSLAARGRLLGHCVARPGCAHPGLLIGRQRGLASLGLTGLLVTYSPDVGTALRSLERYRHLHARGASTTLAGEGRTAIVSGHASTDQVAAMHGYTDASAFTRAVHRWSGTTPTLWRVTRAHRVA